MTYKELLTEAADVKVSIDKEMRPQFKDIAARFKSLFGSYGFKPADFKFLSDLIFDQDREQVLAARVAIALKLNAAMGRDTLEKLLAEHGVFVRDVVEVGDSTSRQHLRDMVDSAQRLQKEMSDAAETIKVDMASRAESEFSIKPGNFMRAVSIAAVGDRDKIREKVEAVEEAVANLDAAMEPLK